MAVREVDEFQEAILADAGKIAKNKHGDTTVIDREISGKMEWIARQEEEDCQLVLGKFGRSINSFCQRVDVDHPHLATFISQHGITRKKFSLICEAIGSAAYIRDHNTAELSELIRSQFTKFKEVSKNFCHEISRPPVRILKSDKERIKARQIKKPNSIPFAGVLEATPCSVHPDSFKSYYCGYDYVDELAAQEKMLSAFDDVQAAAFSRAISTKMDYTKKRVSEQYYGFVRLKMVDAAMILAKSMGLRWESGARCIQVSRDLVPAKLAFWKIADTYGLPNLKYQPNKYPLYSFDAPMPPRVEKLLKLVEHYPATGGKAIFDHYWVVCPSFHLDAREFCHDKKSEKWLLMIDGKEVAVNWHQSKEKSEINPASVALDQHLTKSEFITPVVLGERNGECFFLCYWC
jgi:hypothetical protein